MKLRKFVAILVLAYAGFITYVSIEQNRTIQLQRSLVVELFKSILDCAGGDAAPSNSYQTRY